MPGPLLSLQSALLKSFFNGKRSDRIGQWPVQLKERAGWHKAVVALANKNARILWAVLARGRRFDADHVSVKPEGSATVVPTMAA